MPATFGKLRPQELQRLIDYRGAPREELIVGSHLGRDCGVLDFDGFLVSATCDPITGVTNRAGALAVHLVANDLAASGAEPVAILVSLIFPPPGNVAAIEQTMREIDKTAKTLAITVAGGHTEISDIVNRPLIQCTGLGRLMKSRYPDVTKLQPADEIVMTKTAGIEGTALLAENRARELSRSMRPEEIARARELFEHLSVLPEGRIAAEHDIHCLHDATEGGVVGAVWEVCAGQKLGFTLREDAVPIHPLTGRIGRAFDLDPLKLLSSGTLLIFTPASQPLIQDLHQAGIPAARIGTVESDPACCTIRRRNGTIEPVTTCPLDEFWRIK
ncbi:MAG TPA: AIR synthase family protein [Atribacteraceae bacterium]|nr:AIR synthase family protein [Atribacteraceae bacterium]